MFVSDPFPIGNETQLPDGAWMRVLLTREALPGDAWDGSGVWAFGEVEDYQIALPRSAGADAGAEPQAVPALVCPSEVSLEAAVLVVGLTCSVTNLGGDGMLEARFARASGKSQLLPSQVSLETLRAGAQHTLTLALIRDQPPGQWRYRTQSRDIRSDVADGVVTLGISYGDRSIDVRPRNPEEDVFLTDEEADAFSIATGAAADGYRFADIRRVAAGRAQLDRAVLDVLRREVPVVGTGVPSRVSDEFVAFADSLEEIVKDGK